MRRRVDLDEIVQVRSSGTDHPVGQGEGFEYDASSDREPVQ